MESMKKSSPWVSYVHKLEALFGQDPEISMTYSDESRVMTMFVGNPKKAEALQRLIPSEVVFGNVTLTINIIPCNEEYRSDVLFKMAFDGNPVFKDAVVITQMYSNPMTYVVFAKEVAQYWDDNLGDPHGNVSTLYQNIADDLLKHIDGVMYCTDQK